MTSCPQCCGEDTDVKDSRRNSLDEHVIVKRRRLCRDCGLKFNTFELQEDVYRGLRIPEQHTAALRRASEVLVNYLKYKEE